jgi:Ribbon-helix-helix protein, copG family
MDPLESVSRYRQQQSGNGRALKVAPPPTLPMSPAPPVTTPDVELDDTGELDLTALDDRGNAEAAGAAGEQRLPGNTRGRKQLLYVYLPGPTIAVLDKARPGHGTLGAAVMAALRGSYEWLVEHHTPQPVEAVGPFPAVRGPKRRQGIEEGRLKPFYVDPEEAKGIDRLAEQLEMSVSELVTLALDHWYGDGAEKATTG